MPSTALKHLAKRADVSFDRAEHLYDKAKDVVSKEYGKKHKGYWALVMGITKKMMGLGEEKLTFKNFISEESYVGNIGMMEMFKFFEVATSEQKKQMKELIAAHKQDEAWELLKQVTGVKLK